MSTAVLVESFPSGHRSRAAAGSAAVVTETGEVLLPTSHGTHRSRRHDHVLSSALDDALDELIAPVDVTPVFLTHDGSPSPQHRPSPEVAESPPSDCAAPPPNPRSNR